MSKKEIERTFLVCWSKILSAEKDLSNFSKSSLSLLKKLKSVLHHLKVASTILFFPFSWSELIWFFYVDKEKSVLYNLQQIHHSYIINNPIIIKIQR